MKFYNPFKWHIVQFDNGMFGLRRFHMLSWEYRERPELGKWSWAAPEHVIQFCMFDSVSKVMELREMMKPKKIKVTRIYG